MNAGFNLVLKAALRPVRWSADVVLDHRARTATRGSTVVPFREGSFRFVASVLARRGGVISYAELIEELWAQDLGGGPDDAKNALHTLKRITRERLAAVGMAIRARRSIGFYAVAA